MAEQRQEFGLAPVSLGKLLGALSQFFFQALAFGDIPEIGHHGAHARFIEQIGPAAFQPEPGAVLVPGSISGRQAMSGLLEQLSEQARDLVHLIGMDQFESVPARKLLGGKPADARAGRAGVVNGAVRSHQGDRVPAMLDNAPEPPQRLLSQPVIELLPLQLLQFFCLPFHLLGFLE